MMSFNKLSLVSTSNLIYLFLIIIWDPLQKAILKFDAKGRTLLFFTIFIVLLNLLTKKGFLKSFLSLPTIFWVIWVIYTSLNVIFKGYHEDLPIAYFIFLRLFLPLFSLIISSNEIQINLSRTLFVLFFSFLLYSLLSFFFLTDFSSTKSQLLGELGNAGPLNSLYVIFFAALLFNIHRLSSLNYGIVVSYAFIILILSASQKAFGAAVIILLFHYISKFKFNLKNIFLLVFSFGLLYWSYNFIIDHTVLGSRLSEISVRGEKYNTTNNDYLNLLGDRIFFYITGWEIFLNNPLTGIGLRNFTQVTSSDYAIHSEYMVQLAENGIIGSALFFFFIFFLTRNLIYKIRISKGTYRELLFLSTGGLISILFINITAWTYSFVQYFVCYGTIVGLIKIRKFYDSNWK